ncbi:glycoside hydrolase family 127 protein [Coraliomargarita algicola]|uniref:Glycoside hydrolase family 127 protein n=1 Tax=Coraliomargarita algicola TaxID=3092156 RepID=A0ABZ0RLS5_9BACT|nr:beta-L-arabinofuranosidase domain-containing protein [Coraliomargarita sp. J2-16]WPJ95872.1 glycoside hydrolase family 127 protein [Coraliomargarita sp. J2-16]
MIQNTFNPQSTERISDIPMESPLMGASKLSGLIDRSMILRSLEGMASWLEAATRSAEGVGKCHRMAIYDRSGAVTWMYPNSNSAETISVWLDLADILQRPELKQNAIDYADTLVNDSEKGIYSGPAKDAQGLMWYWTDAGVYSSLYAMRVPAHFMRLHRETGDDRLLAACEMVGKTMVKYQLPSGIVGSGWSPENGWRESGGRVGSRFIYVISTYATLYQLTRDAAYRDAYERAVEALIVMQCEDGSFYQNYDPNTLKVSDTDSSTKCMFFAYIFNALAEAYEVFEDARLLDCAKRLGDFIVNLYYCRGALPYCIGHEILPSDRPEANMAMYECANGLLWLHSLVPDERFKDVGLRLWITGWYNQAEVVDNQDLNGAILIGADTTALKSNDGIPSNRKHLAHDPSRAAKCVLWGMCNHAFASAKLFHSTNLLHEKRVQP